MNKSKEQEKKLMNHIEDSHQPSVTENFDNAMQKTQT